jgi:hypothetical protein
MYGNNISLNSSQNENVTDKSCGANQKTHTHFACWVTKATDTSSEYVLLLLLFHGNSGYANARQCYVYMYTACLVDMLSNTPVCAEGSTSVLVKRKEHKKLKITFDNFRSG